MSQEKIGVLIADDSPVVREILKDMIAGEPDLEVIGEAHHGREAVELVESLRPDIITMDILMPVMNGLEAVEEIMAYFPTPILVFSSAVDDKELDVTFQAIARGALDVMEKPKVPGGEQYENIRRDFLAKLRMLSRIHVIPHLKGKRKKDRGRPAGQAPAPNHHHPAPEPADGRSPDRRARRPAAAKEGPVAAPPPEPLPRELMPEAGWIEMPPRDLVKRKLVAVGASTGGPKALVQIFQRLPRSFPVPLLAVQHIAPSFAQGLVNWLDRESALSVKIAEDKARPEPGCAYVSPTGVHLVVERGLLRLTDGAPVNSCRPSVDVLFSSVAESFGEYAVGVLLTGMGKDGAEGLLAMKKRGAFTIIQDENTSVIFGMPKAALDLGAQDQVVSLPRMPEAIVGALKKDIRKRGER